MWAPFFYSISRRDGLLKRFGFRSVFFFSDFKSSLSFYLHTLKQIHYMGMLF
ncbi:hypothetical protein CHCC20375_2358 [Bacillus licheniformis]|nr:hypothetical protein CHCC20375_2358 [Bacillus licheniformis]